MSTERNGTAKIGLIGGGIIMGFLFLLMRLWQLQVLEGDEYREMSESNRTRVIGVPAPRGIIFDRNGIPLVKNTAYFCASLMPGELDRGLVPALAKMIGMPEEEITALISRRGQSPSIPVRLKEGLTPEEVSYIEARRSDFPGLLIEIETSRDYLYGGTGAHIVGYLGKMTPTQAKNPEFRDVPPDAFIGQWGVEKLYDKHLRGTAGQRIIEVDALGREIRLLRENPPVRGKDLTLSIDIALQHEAERAFEGRAGAVAALKPDTGEILGLVSSPSFDPNKFSKGIRREDWVALMEDEKKPMLNRALQSQYPPGSTFKIVMAVAGLESGLLSENEVVDCRGGIGFGKWRFGCWRKTGHHSVSLRRALVESCDVYFYEAGRKLGIDTIHEYATRLGLGGETGIELGTEKKGLIPSTKWKKEARNEPWYLGETFVNSIGQGYVSATPLQMAVMTSAVSNGGDIYRPSLIKGQTPVITKKSGIRPETLDKVRAHLGGVVSDPSGTAHASQSLVTTMGGKTGTAQVVGILKDSKYLIERFRDHAWFVAFAPVEKPGIALSVLVEHGGHGASAAAPIAKKAIEAYLLPLDKKKELLDVQN